jgi:hypothetical protein|tara:strand:- start:258 stop:542 length:285 start_codon:yes stop_codon:yes gene_type:complete
MGEEEKSDIQRYKELRDKKDSVNCTIRQNYNPGTLTGAAILTYIAFEAHPLIGVAVGGSSSIFLIKNYLKYRKERKNVKEDFGRLEQKLFPKSV